MKYPKALENLIEDFSKLPSVGKKTAERYALYVYFKMQDDDVFLFGKHLSSIKNEIHVCKTCGNICEEDYCSICLDSSRNNRQILVVETVKDLYTISRGIGISDLNIESLVNKVRNNEVDEVILATNATLEGETTARYIKELLIDENVKITRIAHGLPVGGDLSYADEMTVLKAMEGRREY